MAEAEAGAYQDSKRKVHSKKAWSLRQLGTMIEQARPLICQHSFRFDTASLPEIGFTVWRKQVPFM